MNTVFPPLTWLLVLILAAGACTDAGTPPSDSGSAAAGSGPAPAKAAVSPGPAAPDPTAVNQPAENQPGTGSPKTAAAPPTEARAIQAPASEPATATGPTAGLKTPANATASAPAARAESALIPIPLVLPKPLFIGTPRNIRVKNLEKARTGPRPPLLAPAGVKNVALGKTVTSSDEEPIIGELAFITDGEKSGQDGTYVDLTFGTQYVQIDLEAVHEIHAIVFWHFHAQGRVYHDVVVQVADDEDFITRVHTLFNNDDDNSSGLGVGKDLPYMDTHEGKLIHARGVKARYVRLYSRGNTSNDQNHYVEVEVYGKPVK